MTTASVRLEKSGRILIPAEWRRRFNLREGSELILRIVGDTIQVLGTREQAVRRAQSRLARYRPTDRLASEELIAERRQEREREDPK